MAKSIFAVFMLLIASLICTNTFAYSNSLGFNTAAIEKLIGKKGQVDLNNDNFKMIVPRDDINVIVNGVQIVPEIGAASEIIFKKTEGQLTLIGDIVLTQDQINPVMSVALAHNLQVTGLHNLFLWDAPRILSMHIAGTGNERQLALAMRDIFKKITATSNGNGDIPVGFEQLTTSLNTNRIDKFLGIKGTFKNGSYQIAFKQKLHLDKANYTMNAHSWANFMGSDSRAIVNGDLIVHAAELQKVLAILRKANIQIFTIYERAIEDNSTVFSITYLGIGDIKTLATTLRSAFQVAQALPIPEKKTTILVLTNFTPITPYACCRVTAPAGLGPASTPIQTSEKNDTAHYPNKPANAL